MSDNFEIRHLRRDELSEALQLTWKVFNEFESPDYSNEGILEFKNFISLPSILKKIQSGEFIVWGCIDNNKIVGIIATRPPCHISLLFVDKLYHRKGIAKSMLHKVMDYYKSGGENNKITVNSSPYAADIYRRMGFTSTAAEQTVNGIRFFPMEMSF